MTSTTRWVEYLPSAIGSWPTTISGLGTRAYSLATASVGDSFDIGANNNQLHVTIDGTTGPHITLVSGTDLDPRFVARNITEKLHNLGKSENGFDYAQCIWENNQLKLYGGSQGAGKSVTVISGTNTAYLELGWGSKSEVGGSAGSNGYNGGLTVSGTFGGFFDEMYKIIIHFESNVGTPSKGGSNSYTGTITAGGAYDGGADATYTLTINVTNGTTMGGGTDNVPTMSWSASGISDTGGPVELLYPNYWYQVGTKGLMVKFSDAVFNTCDPAWTIACTQADDVDGGANPQGGAGSAKYIWSSTRGDDAAAAIVTSDSAFTRLGSRGLNIKFTGSNNFDAGDEFYVVCRPPQPKSYNITNLNYGNCTVSTESNVKTVIFEIMSGAVEMDTVKFGLQSHGTFQHHNAGNNDTKFRFGTVGPGNNAGSSPIDGIEWKANITSADIASDVPPAYLYSLEDNLSVVADADTSETIGNSHYMGMVSDPMWMNIKLGASEVGANSTVNFRIYYDYS